MQSKKIEISYKTIIFTILILLALQFLWLVKDLIFLFLICFILASALNPTITRLERYKISRVIAILLVYLVALSVFSYSLATIIPILIDQTAGLIQALPSALENIKFFGTSATNLSSQLKILETIPADIAKTLIGLFSNLLSAIVMLVLTFYLLLERKNFPKYARALFGPRGQSLFLKTITRLELRLHSWVSGELVLMTIIGVLSYLGYYILGLNYCLPLALIAGLMEIIPNIGPIFSTIIALIVALNVSPLTALLTVIWGIIIQQIENSLITPRIMKAKLGLHPIITIMVITIGAKIAGVIGALLAVPIYLTLATVIEAYSNRQ
jgi:predicted PurR-regulated permease PerM